MRRGWWSDRRPVAARAGLALLLAVLAATASAGELYRWKDAAGVTHYSDSPPPDAQAELRRYDDADAAPRPSDGTPALYRPPPIDASASAAAPEIVMYGRPDCGYCVKAERYFNARGLAFRNLDISRSPAAHAEFRRLGGQGTPLIFVDGERVRGFNQARLDRLLGGG